MKEIGSEAEVDRALQEADDPQSVLWRGRATHINNLTRQLKDAKKMLASKQGAHAGNQVVKRDPYPVKLPLSPRSKSFGREVEIRRKKMEQYYSFKHQIYFVLNVKRLKVEKFE